MSGLKAKIQCAEFEGEKNRMLFQTFNSLKNIFLAFYQEASQQLLVHFSDYKSHNKVSRIYLSLD